MWAVTRRSPFCRLSYHGTIDLANSRIVPCKLVTRLPSVPHTEQRKSWAGQARYPCKHSQGSIRVSLLRAFCGILATMHEMAVTESILEIVLRHARAANARRVLSVTLVIGELTGFVDDSIQFYFDFMSKDTPAQDARLIFERIQPRARCQECGSSYTPPNSRLWTCPECGALGGEVIAGREFSVASIEIE